MKATGLFGRKYVNVEKREYELGAVGPNEALVEVKASGVCGTDLNFLRDSDDDFHPLGHELSGVVLETGLPSSTFPSLIKTGWQYTSSMNPPASLRLAEYSM